MKEARKACILVSHDEQALAKMMVDFFRKKLRNVEVVLDEERRGFDSLLYVVGKHKPDLLFFNPSRVKAKDPEPIRDACVRLRRRRRKMKIIVATSWSSFNGVSTADICADGLILVPDVLQRYLDSVVLHLPFTLR